MRYLISSIILLFTINLSAQTWQTQAGTYNKPDGLWPQKVFRLPTDTTSNKQGLTAINGKLYVGDGTKWNLGTAATSAVDTIYNNGDTIFYTKFGSTYYFLHAANTDSLTFATWKRLYKVRDSLLAAGNTFTGINTFQTDYVYFKGKTDLTIIDGTDTVRVGKGTYGIYDKALVVGTDQSNPVIFATNKTYRGKFSDSGLHVYSPYIYLNNGADTAATKSDLRSISGGSGTGGLSGGNLGAGWRLYYPPSQGVKTLRTFFGISFDSTSLTDNLAISVDSLRLSTWGRLYKTIDSMKIVNDAIYSYTAGNGLTLSLQRFKVDTSIIETKAYSLNYFNILTAANGLQDLAISNHTSQISTINSTLTSLSSSVSTNTTSISSLNTTVASHTSSISSLNTSVASKLNASDSVYYQLRYPDANVQSSSYTLVLSDAGKFVDINNASSVTLTVPPNASVAFPIGTIVNVVQRGDGQITFTPGSGVTINSINSWLKSAGKTAGCTLRKIGTNTWDLYGAINP